MGIFGMIATGAPIPEGVYDVAAGSVLLGLFGIVLAIGTVLFLAGCRSQFGVAGGCEPVAPLAPTPGAAIGIAR